MKAFLLRRYVLPESERKSRLVSHQRVPTESPGDAPLNLLFPTILLWAEKKIPTRSLS
jgi:hypothetical protein